MSTDSGRDDFIIAIRSAFLKKGNRQKFSLFTLLIISSFVLSLEYFKTGPVDKFRSITKDVIFKGSSLISSPFVYIKEQYYLFQDHMKMYEEYTDLKDKNLKIESLKKENQYYKSENEVLKKLIEEKKIFKDNYLLSKVLLDQQSPFLKSVIVNKGINHGIKNGKAVKKKSYFVGKIVNVNYLTSRILLASDLNSKIPVLIEPGRVNAILSGNGNNDYAELEYLPKVNDIKNGDVVYTSGIDGTIDEGIPIGRVFLEDDSKFVKFFVDFTQLKFVMINN